MKDLSTSLDRFDATMDMNDQKTDLIDIGGVFTVQCFSADGQLKWEEGYHNLVVKVGLQNMNDVYLRAQTQSSLWYVGLVDNSGWTAFSYDDTLGTHTGWIEFTNYSGSRKQLTFSAATGNNPSVIATSAPAAFNILGTGTIKGAFVCNASTGSGGILFSEGAFSATRNVVNGDTLNVNYSLSTQG